MSFGQNDPPMGEQIWQNNSFATHILFEQWLIMIFSPPERKLAKRTSVKCTKKYLKKDFKNIFF